MDIAKIRKKLKESDSERKQTGPDANATEQEPSQVREDANLISAPAAGHPSVQIEYQRDSGKQRPESGSASPGAEKTIFEDSQSAEHEQIASLPKTESTPAKEVRAQDNEPPSPLNGKPHVKDEEDGRTDEIIEILTFRLFKEEFAFQISQLKEILKYQRITKVPKMPDYVIGITSLRGKVIPVIDLRTKVSSNATQPGLTSRVKILIVKGPKGLIGAVVDKVIGVVRIAKSEILPPPSHLAEEQAKFVEGIAVIEKRFVSILNMEETITVDFNGNRMIAENLEGRDFRIL